MRYKIISTGSKGNAVIINNIVMIDCGVSYKALREVWRGLKLVLLTHIHGDHFKKTTIKRLAKERPTLRFACCEWLKAPLTECGVKNIDVLEPGKKYDYGTFKVSPFELYHDVPNCGYRLYFGNEKALYATDTSTMDGIQAGNYDLYFIECNYEDEELIERIHKKEREGKFSYEKSVPGRHLSKRQCNEFLYNNMGYKSKYIYLHEHKESEQ